MQKKFLKNLGLLLFLNLLVKPFWILGVDRQVQNVVGTQEYGLYFTIINFSFLFYIFLDLGITNFNNRNIAQHNQLLNKHLAGISMLKLVLGILYAIIIFIAGIIWGYTGRELYLLAWVGFNQFLLSFILYVRSNLSGLLLFKTDSFLSVLDRLLMILICGFLLWFNFFEGLFTIEWFVYSQTAAYVITLLAATVAVINKSGKLKINWNLPFFILIAKKSMPFALLVLIMSFYNRIDPVLIERLLPSPLGKEQAGVYAQAFRLLDAGQNFSLLFAILLLPLFAKMLNLKESVEKLVKLSFSIIISGSLIIAITSQFFANDIMQLMYYSMPGETEQHFMQRIEQSATIFKLLMFSFVAISSNYIFGTLLTANNNLKKLNIIAFSGLLINLTLNFILIPHYHSIGSAYASLATQSITALFQLILVYHIFRFRINYKLMSNLILLIVILTTVGYLLKEYTHLRWEISLVVMLISGLSLTIWLKLLNIRQFISIIKDK
ncbi:MAG: oligosaccharide flippase family protein [Bacteroidetes bacterium]|nr:oligosaccharide flippase family protein [Bacteroidota bacterium]MBL6943726.1 oligosaccharide flippase family protein [Bacteroidales bacterium]